MVKGIIVRIYLHDLAKGNIFDNKKIRFSIPNKSGTYSIVTTNNGVISAAQNSAVRRSFRIDNVVTGAYDVRLKVVSRSHSLTDSTASVRCYWTELTQIIYDDLCHPGKSLGWDKGACY